MVRLTMQQLHWVPLDVKQSSIPRQTIADPGIKDDVKCLVQDLCYATIVASNQLTAKKALLITDAADYLHDYLTQLTVTPEDIMMYVIHFLSVVFKDVPTSLCDSQLASIETVRAIFSNWITVKSSQTVPFTAVPNPPKLIVAFPKPSPICYPAPTSKGDHGQDRFTTSKGSFKQQIPVNTKGRHL